MKRTSSLGLAAVPAVIISLGLFIGCGGDGTSAPSANQSGPTDGIVLVDPQPVELQAPWTVDGPDGYTLSGNGAARITGRQAGSYTLTWGDHDGWVKPSASSAALVAGDSIRFEGLYTVLGGSIVIEPEPDTLVPSWTLSGPDGFLRTGSGAHVFNSLDKGVYTLVWEDVAGWIAPEPMTAALRDAEGIVFVGRYIEWGFVSIDTEPDDPERAWSLSGPDGSAAQGLGDEILDEMVPGAYSVTWSDADGWFTPEVATGELAPGGLLELSGRYVRIGRLSLDVSPDDPAPEWRITGTTGFQLTGQGDAELDVPSPATYTVEWLPLSSEYSTPENAVVELAAGGTALVAGSYELLPGTIEFTGRDEDFQPSRVICLLSGPGVVNLEVMVPHDGFLEMTDVPPGTYHVQWLFECYAAGETTKTLAPGGTIRFAGVFGGI